MKHTKENIKKVIEANIKTCRALEEIGAEKGDDSLRREYMHERWGLEFALWCLTDKNYFNDMVKALKLEEEE